MHGFFTPVAFVVGLLLLLVGERMFGPGHGLRVAVSLLGVLGLLAAFGLRVKQWLAAAGETRRVLGRLLPAYGTVALGLVLYALTLDGMPFGEDGTPRTVLRVLWPIVFVVGLGGAAFMEGGLRSMYGAQRLETRRLLESGRAGVVLALALSWLTAANFTANREDERIDLRSLKTLEPSQGTVEIVRNLSEPVTVTLFFPPGNDVAEQVAPYFDKLAEASSQLTVETLDRDMSPKRAKELRARKNGTIVVTGGDNHESLVLDVDPDKARRKLKKLDGDFQESLAKAVREQRVAYIVTGHGERSTSPRADDPSGLKTLKDGLQRLNYKVKKLGPSEGLTDAVPDDATVVMVVGPTAPMLEAEEQALVRYVQGGGSLVLLLDPEFDEDPTPKALLAALGVTVDLTPLAHDTKYVRFRGGKTDRSILVTNRFTTHDSTRVLSKLSSRVALLLPTTGSVDKADDVPDGADVKFTVRTMSGTWADLDGNLDFDSGLENKEVRKLVAAVQLTPPEGGEGQGGRALVAADADLLSDLVLGQAPGNNQWLSDGLRWLEDEVQLAGEVAEVEDVPILHTRDEDKAWFFATTLGAPILLLGLGAGISLRRRRRSTP